MHRLTLLLLLLLAIGAAVFWGTSEDPAVPFESIDLESGQRESADGLPIVPGVEDQALGSGANVLQREAAKLGQSVVVTGRCIDAQSGASLPGCKVSLRAQPLEVTGPAPDSGAPDSGPAGSDLAELSSLTLVDGKFRVEIQVPPMHGIAIRAAMAGHVEVTGTLTRLDSAIALGDIAIPRGARLDARVVDGDGVVLPGIPIRFSRSVQLPQPNFSSQMSILAVSDAAGRLHVPGGLVQGTWSATTTGDVSLVRPRGKIEIDAELAPQQIDFVVSRPDPRTLITGSIVAPDGTPVRWAAVRALGDNGAPVGIGRSDGEGRFRVRCGSVPGNPVRLSVSPLREFEPMTTREVHAWGSSGIVLQLRRAGSVTLQVVDAGSGQPVEDFAITCCGAGGGSSGWHKYEPVAKHADGLAVLSGVPRGKVHFVATPRNRRFVANTPVELVKEDRDAVVRIELARRKLLEVRVVFAGGQPAVGSQLDLLQSLDQNPVTLLTEAIPTDRLTHIGSSGVAMILDTALTNEEGRAVIGGADSLMPLAVRVTGQSHLTMVKAVTLSDATSVEMTVEAGANVTGVIKPALVLQELVDQFRGQPPTVTLEHGGGLYPSRSATVDGAGEFAFTAIHSGVWIATFHMGRRDPGGDSGAPRRQLRPLTIRAGDSQQLDIDVTSLQPATLHGMVLVGGAPAAGRRVHLARLEPLANGGLKRSVGVILTTNADGGFEADSLAPGRYGVVLHSDGSSNATSGKPHAIACQDAVEIVAGQQASHTFRIETGTLRVRVESQDGQPVAGCQLVLQGKTSGHRMHGRTDASGLLQVEKCGVGALVVFAQDVSSDRTESGLQARNQSVVLGTVLVKAGASGLPTVLLLRKD